MLIIVVPRRTVFFRPNLSPSEKAAMAPKKHPTSSSIFQLARNQSRAWRRTKSRDGADQRGVFGATEV